jgi:hypothetical protein
MRNLTFGKIACTAKPHYTPTTIIKDSLKPEKGILAAQYPMVHSDASS